jgi:ABC-type uncharacterized transport system auxiliary subunit
LALTLTLSLPAILALSACGSLFKQPNPNKLTYLLPSLGTGAGAGSGMETPTPPRSGGTVVAVRPFRIAAEYSDKSLTYRLGEVQTERDYYNAWLVQPDAMITERLREWLSGSGLAAHVQDSGSLVAATHVIEGSILELGGDYRDKANSKAVVAIRFTVLPADRAASGSSLLHKTYRAEVAIPDRDPNSLVEGLGTALVQVFNDFGADLGGKLP